MAASKTTPPITPPTIAPVGALDVDAPCACKAVSELVGLEEELVWEEELVAEEEEEELEAGGSVVSIAR